MVNVTVNKKAGIETVHDIISAHANKEGIFQFSFIVPENRFSKGFDIGSKKHSLFLFYSILLDALRDSNKVYSAGRRLAMEYDTKNIIKLAENFDKNFITGDKKNCLETVMGRILDNGIGDPANILYKAALRLEKFYAGDPRLLFKGLNNYDEAKLKLKKFHGIANGKASLMVKNFIRFGYFNMNNPFDMPIKIDRHGIKISIGNNLIDVKDYKKGQSFHIGNFVPKLENLFRKISREEEVSPVLLDDLKWYIGNSLCTKKDYRFCEELCPLSCSKLVQSNKSGSYVVLSSDVRSSKVINTGGLFGGQEE